jgi:4-amino-4-deoxy-L-arabinose transferase-like glycosyltransferase
LTLGVVFRLLVFRDLSRHPLLLEPHLDALSYLNWAREIATTDFWGRGIFFQAPGYPYLMGCFFKLFGIHPGGWVAVQFAMSLGTSLLLYWLALELFGFRSALFAGIVAATYPVLIYFDQVLLKTSTSVFFGTLVLCGLHLLTRRRGSFRLHFLAGLVLGAACLVKETYLLLLPVAVLLPWAVRKPGARRTDLLRVSGWVLGCALILGAMTARNVLRGGEFVIITSQAGPNFYMGNNPATDGTFRRPKDVAIRRLPEYESGDFKRVAEETLGRPLSSKEVSDYWFARGLAFIAEQPKAFLRLLWNKWLLVWTRVEIPDNYSLPVFQSYSPALRLIPLDFAWLVLFSFSGLALARRRIREFSFIPAFCGVHILSLLLFLVNSRYRMDLMPPMVLLGSAVVSTTAARRRDWVLAAGMGLLGLCFSLAPAYRAEPGALTYAQAQVLLSEGHTEEGLAMLRETVRISPRHHLAWHLLGYTAFSKGDFEQAAEDLKRSLSAEPINAGVWGELGVSLARLGRLKPAEKAFRNSLRIAPDSAEVRRNLALLFIQTRRDRLAAEVLGPAASRDPLSARMLKDLNEGTVPPSARGPGGN